MSNWSKSQLTDITQHELGEFVGSGLDAERRAELAYLFGRACFPHCVAMAREYFEGPIAGHVFEYTSIIEASGPRPDGTHDTGLYVHEQGWSHTAMADLLRLEGYDVFVQNIALHRDQLDAERALQLRRVSTDRELKLMQALSGFSGQERMRWITAVTHAKGLGAKAIATITIPRRDGAGSGGHTVLITDVKNGQVRYLDPDALAQERYGDTLQAQGLTTTVGLQYQQPAARFAERMTGEVMWILPPEARFAHSK